MKAIKKYLLTIALFLTFAFILAPFNPFTARAEGDTTKPVLSISDVTVHTYIGSQPVLGVTAIDETDGEVSVGYEWSENALDGLGTLLAGEHICTISASDAAGNITRATVTYIVSEDTATNSGYVFVTVVCEGMATTVKAYPLQAAIDLSGYVEKEGFTRVVKNGAGETVTSLFATEDCTLYVTYEEMKEENVGSVERPSGDETSGDGRTQKRIAIALWVAAGAVAIVGMATVGVLAAVKSGKNRGDKE